MLQIPKLTPISNTKYFRLEEELVVDVDGMHIVVPAGFITDGASTPKFLWKWLPRVGPAYTAAGVVHDWLYKTKYVTVKRADEIFFLVMKMYDVQAALSLMMWMFVRGLGWWFYLHGGDRGKYIG